MKLKNLDKIDIPEEIKDKFINIFKNYVTLTKVVIFGSRARKDNKENSDIDIAVYGLKKDLQIKFNDDVDSINTIYSFDICFIDNFVSKDLINNIEKEGVIIYGK